jgi:hypothetical protein
LGGGAIAKAFGQVEAGLIDRYYRRRKKFPDEIDEINKEAQAEAHKERSFEREGFEARHERASWALKEAARRAVLELVPELERIARGEPRHVEIEDAGGTISYKTIIPYPRDQIAAFKALVDSARYGFLPQKIAPPIVSAAETKEDEHKGGLLPIFSANPNFKRIEARTPDGKRVVAEVGKPGVMVIEEDDD